MITLQIILDSSLCKILNTKDNLIKYLSNEITKKIDLQYPQNKFFAISETIELLPDFFWLYLQN